MSVCQYCGQSAGLGIELSERTLVPGDDAELGETRLATWLSQPTSQIQSTKPQPLRKAG